MLPAYENRSFKTLNRGSDNMKLLLDREPRQLHWLGQRKLRTQIQTHRKIMFSWLKSFHRWGSAVCCERQFKFFSPKRYPRLYPKHVAKYFEMDHSGAVHESAFLNESFKWTNPGSLPCTESNVSFAEVSPLWISDCFSRLTREPTEIDCGLWRSNIIGWAYWTNTPILLNDSVLSLNHGLNESRSGWIENDLICYQVKFKLRHVVIISV